MAVSLIELCLLFVGDEFTEGHPTVPLAMAICEQVNPQDADVLKRWLYPFIPSHHVNYRESRIIETGFRRWKERCTV